MKKLALAASIALGLSAFGAGPATAAGLDAAPTDTSQANAVHNAETVAPEEANRGDAEHLAVKYANMTQIEITGGKGIEYTVDALKAGDVVTTNLNDEKSTVKKDGPFDGSIRLDEKPDVNSTVNLKVTVKRDGKTVRDMLTVIKIVDSDRGAYVDGTLVTNRPSIREFDFSNDGINLAMVKCGSDDEVHFKVFKKDGKDKQKVWEKSQLTGDDKAAAVRFMPDSSEEMAGKYEITAECGDLEDSATLTAHKD